MPIRRNEPSRSHLSERDATMAYLNQTSAQTSSFTARVAAVFERFAARQRQNRLYRETYNGLNALTDRELSDLGLHRSELARVARDAVNR